MPSGYDDKAKRMSQNKPKLRYLRTIINHLLAHAQQKSYPIHADCTESFSTEFAKIELAKERFRGTQRENSSKPLKHISVKRILLFKR